MIIFAKTFFSMQKDVYSGFERFYAISKGYNNFSKIF